MIDFTRIFQLKGLKPPKKGHTNFYECCDLTKKVCLMYLLNKWVEEKAEVLCSSKGQHSPHDPISMWTLVVTNSPLIISRVTVFFEVARANMPFRIIYK